MNSIKQDNSTQKLSTPRYIVMSIIATLLLAAGIFGFISGLPQFANLASEYQSLLHANWKALVALGVFVGVMNLVITLKQQ